MNKKNRLVQLGLGVVAACLAGSVSAETPVLQIKALTRTSLVLPSNSTAVVKYLLTNQVGGAYTISMRSIPGVQQQTNGKGLCSERFTLANKGSSCTLSLLVVGSQMTANINGGPLLCQSTSAAICQQPQLDQRLNVRLGAPITQATLSIVGASNLRLAQSGSGEIKITNHSQDIAATNIHSRWNGSALSGHVSESRNNCAKLAPKGSCTISYTADDSFLAQTAFTIKGDNTNALYAAIAVGKSDSPEPEITSISPAVGSSLGGTQVQLKGHYLRETTEIRFGEDKANDLTVINDQLVQASTPEHSPGSVDVQLTTGNGSTILPKAFTFAAAPELQSLAPSAGSIIGGTIITLKGQHLAGVSQVLFAGKEAVDIQPVDDETVLVLSPKQTETGSVTVELLTPDGRSSLAKAFEYQALALGQSTAGGVIAGLAEGANDLVLAEKTTKEIIWGPEKVLTQATDEKDGASNSQKINKALAEAQAYAAKFCAEYEVDAFGNSPCQAGKFCYNDWFLPAKAQLELINQNRLALKGLQDAVYWSSTEYAKRPANAWAQLISKGQKGKSFIINKEKNAVYAICVRHLER